MWGKNMDSGVGSQAGGDSEPQLATCPQASLSSSAEWESQLLPLGGSED